MRKVLGGVMLAAAIGAGAAPALAQKSADTLRITWRDAVPDITPYYNQLRTGIVIGHQVWDSLVYRDYNFRSRHRRSNGDPSSTRTRLGDQPPWS